MTDRSRFSVSRETTRRAQKLRGDPTPAEKKLWFKLRLSQLDGRKFRRQHAVGPYILDFYCPALKLCIELDGDSHGEAGAAAHDAQRTAYLESRGVSVTRFANQDVHGDIETVAGAIFEECLLIEARKRVGDGSADGV